MNLQVNDKWRIVSDSEQWIAQKFNVREKGKYIGLEEWVSVAYFTRPDAAALWLAHRRVRDLPGTYPAADALEVLGGALQGIAEDINAVLGEMK